MLGSVFGLYVRSNGGQEQKTLSPPGDGRVAGKDGSPGGIDLGSDQVPSILHSEAAIKWDPFLLCQDGHL